MHALRWILGIVTVFGTAVFLALLILGDGFRRSYGASGIGSLKVAMTLVVQGALLASIVAPHQRLFLHGVAALVITLVAGCLRVCRESAFIGTTGVAYGGLWLAYYWQVTGGSR